MTIANDTKERPILFNAEMVRAVLDGRKTQTRRICKSKPIEGTFAGYGKDAMDAVIRQGPYEVGMNLWVRETWASLRMEYDFESGYCDGWEETTPDRVKKYRDEHPPHLLQAPAFDIAYLDCYDNGADNVEERGFRWRPSIHMPRWASRIDLLIKDVRVERVQDINVHSVLAEGISAEINDYTAHLDFGQMRWEEECLKDFRKLWDSVYQKRGFGWDKNPYVWVVEFEVIIPHDFNSETTHNAQ